jgi:hypothetical protein
MSEIDGNYLKNYAVLSKQNSQLCELFRLELKLLRSKNNVYEVVYDFKGNKIVIYVKDKILFMPSCIALDEVKIISLKDKCFENIPVSISNRNILGFLNPSGVITQFSKEISCINYLNIFHLKNQNSFLYVNSTSIWLSKIAKPFSLSNFVRGVQNLEITHYDELVNELHIGDAHVIDAQLEIKESEDKILYEKIETITPNFLSNLTNLENMHSYLSFKFQKFSILFLLFCIICIILVLSLSLCTR